MNENSWDKYWKTEDDLDYWEKPDQIVLDLIEQYDNEKYNKVLDLGCGIGRHVFPFLKASYIVTAVDNSEQALKKINKKKDKFDLDINTVKGDYLNKTFPDNSFDIIISINVIYHGEKEDFKAAIKNCKDYLKNEGIFLFTCPTRDDGKYGNGKEIVPHTFLSLNSVHPGDAHYFASKEDILNSLNDMEIIYIKKEEYYWDNNGKKEFSSYWQVLSKNK
jgi:SAM-dependent methyltransferase